MLSKLSGSANQLTVACAISGTLNMKSNSNSNSTIYSTPQISCLMPPHPTDPPRTRRSPPSTAIGKLLYILRLSNSRRLLGPFILFGSPHPITTVFHTSNFLFNATPPHRSAPDPALTTIDNHWKASLYSSTFEFPSASGAIHFIWKPPSDHNSIPHLKFLV